MEQNELTLEQAKNEIGFLSEIQKRQTMEIGNLSTAKISLVLTIEQKDKQIRELRQALDGMIKEVARAENKEQRSGKDSKTEKKPSA